MKSYLEQAFGRGDVTSARMQAAIREWLNLYYGTQSPGEDAADRLAVLVVSKLCRTVFAEYESRTTEALIPEFAGAGCRAGAGHAVRIGWRRMPAETRCCIAAGLTLCPSGGTAMHPLAAMPTAL